MYLAIHVAVPFHLSVPSAIRLMLEELESLSICNRRLEDTVSCSAIQDTIRTITMLAKGVI